jgi:hypothetical protein
MSTSRDGMRCWVEECGRDATVHLTLDESAGEQEALGVDVCVLHASRMLHDGRWTLTMSLRAARDAHLKRTIGGHAEHCRPTRDDESDCVCGWTWNRWNGHLATCTYSEEGGFVCAAGCRASKQIVSLEA